MSEAIDVRSLSHAQLLDVYLPATARILRDEDGSVIAIWGLAWGDARCWLWFHVENYRPGYGLTVLKEARRMFRMAAQLGETRIYAPRDASFDTSERLLKLLRFELNGHEQGFEIWTREVP